MTKDEIFKVYDTVLCIHSMDETVKLNSQPTRKTILVLSQVIDQALGEKKGDGMDLLSFLPEEAQELRKLAQEYLERAGITNLAEKLKKLPAK